MKQRALSAIRGLLSFALAVSVFMSLWGIADNDGSGSIPGFAGFLVFGVLRWQVFCTEAEMAELEKYSESPWR